MKTVSSVYSLLVKTIDLSHSTQLAGGTVFRKPTVCDTMSYYFGYGVVLNVDFCLQLCLFRFRYTVIIFIIQYKGLGWAEKKNIGGIKKGGLVLSEEKYLNWIAFILYYKIVFIL